MRRNILSAMIKQKNESFGKGGIVMKCAADFRRIAREALRGKWKIAVLAGFVALLLGGVVWEGTPEINFQFNDGSIRAQMDILGQNVDLMQILQSDSPRALWGVVLMYFSVVAILVAIVQFVLGCIVTVGYACFNLELVDGEEVTIGTLFQYFPQWKTMVIAGLLQTLYIFLWTLLFIIPGIIAAYRYAMTSYILAENPEMKAGEAIDRSKELMMGNKWRLFCLHFSFIGWGFLCMLTMGIGNLWLTPYMEAATAAFYRDITAPLADEEMTMLSAAEA